MLDFWFLGLINEYFWHPQILLHKPFFVKKIFLSTIALLILSVILISWGNVGHKKISESSSLSFN